MKKMKIKVMNPSFEKFFVVKTSIRGGCFSIKFEDYGYGKPFYDDYENWGHFSVPQAMKLRDELNSYIERNFLYSAKSKTINTKKGK